MDNAVDIIFRTRAELAGARATEEQLQRQIGQAKALGNNYDDLEKKLQRVQATIKSSPTPAGPGVGEMFTKIREGLGDIIPGFAKLDGIMGKFAGGALGAIAGGFGAVAAALTGAKAALDKFASAEQTVAKLDAALAQAGLLTDSYREKLQGLAHGSEQWLGVLTRLTQFDAKPENIEAYMQSVKDLAGILGGDIEQAAHIFSLALQGNFEMLHRYGIRVDESKTKTEQLADAQAQMAQHGRGQLDAANEGIAGGFRKVGREAGNLLEGFGRIIASTGFVQATASGLSTAFGFWAEKIGGVVPKLDALQNKFKPLGRTALEAADAERQFAESQGVAAKATDDHTSAIDRQIQSLDAIKALMDQMEDAEMAFELAQAKLSGATGADLLGKEVEIRGRYAKQKFDREQANIQAKIDTSEVEKAKAGAGVLEVGEAIAAQKTLIGKQETIEKARANAQTADNDVKKAEGQRIKRFDQATAGPEKVAAAEAQIKRAKEVAEIAHALVDVLGPGVKGKSAADLKADLDRLQGKQGPDGKYTGGLLQDRQKVLDDAEARAAGNPLLRRQLEFNKKTFGYRSEADRITGEVGIATETEAEQKKQKEEAERRTKENRTDASLGLAPVQGSAQSLNQASQAQGLQLARTLDVTTATLQQNTATLARHEKELQRTLQIAKDIKNP